MLRRQLKRLGVDALDVAPDATPDRAPSAATWLALCQHVSRAYEERDQECQLLERSQDLASQEMTALYVTLRGERERAEAASQAKSRFLANMSHELRTPLNAVIGAAQLLKTGGDDAEQREHLVDAIQRSGTNLLGLIENILDLSRIEAGELKLQPHDFHLVDCLESALVTSGLAARAKGLQLACIVAPKLPAWRHGDAGRLRQVLLNLLGNAVKFTLEGEIVVRVERGPGADDVRIAITDTGIGIGPASLPQVFDAFRQADDGTQRRFGGSGLGLAIVRQLVEAMGGHIGVRSTLGQGSCFDLVLPLPPACEAAPEAPAPGPRVAYFEPHEPSAEALAALLGRMGCAVTRCLNGHDLRAWCQSDAAGAPQAQPSSWVLACIDSAQTAEVLEQAGELLDPERLIGMSCFESYDAERARERHHLPRGLVKPVLRAALASRFARRAAADGAVALPLPLPSAAQTPDPVHVLVVEDDALNQTIVSGLLKHGGCQVSAVADGQSAIAALRQAAYDVVLMDWQMPDMDGLEVTRRMRAGEAGAAAVVVPVIALTANAFAEDRNACLSAGMNDFLTKPVLAASLRAAVQRWARRGAAGRAGVSASAPSASSASSAPPSPSSEAAPPSAPPVPPATVTEAAVFDATVLSALPMVVDGSEPDYGAEVLAMFRASLPPTLASIRQATLRGDLKSVQRAVHTLKSSSAAVGARALAACAEQAETALRLDARLSPDLPDLLHGEFHRLFAALGQRLAPAEAGPTC